MKYYLSRQCQWPTGDHVVEIAAGGLDRSGPDMLCEEFKRLGEGEEFIDPREALEAALAIREAWHRQLGADKVRIEAGYNVDMFIMSEYPTDEELQKWAEKEWEATPKCDQCGRPMEPTNRWCIYEFGEDGPQFCSERCADKYQEKYWETDEIC